LDRRVWWPWWEQREKGEGEGGGGSSLPLRTFPRQPAQPACLIRVLDDLAVV
jgi:hypothetical protein